MNTRTENADLVESTMYRQVLNNVGKEGSVRGCGNHFTDSGFMDWRLGFDLAVLTLSLIGMREIYRAFENNGNHPQKTAGYLITALFHIQHYLFSGSYDFFYYDSRGFLAVRFNLEDKCETGRHSCYNTGGFIPVYC